MDDEFKAGWNGLPISLRNAPSAMSMHKPLLVRKAWQAAHRALFPAPRITL